MQPSKTLNNSDTNGAEKQVKDTEKWGNPDSFELICKASSTGEGWMKSTKAMEIPGVGCLVQVSTQQDGNVAEAVCFVPGISIQRDLDLETHKVVSRKLVSSQRVALVEG